MKFESSKTEIETYDMTVLDSCFGLGRLSRPSLAPDVLVVATNYYGEIRCK